MLLKTVRLTALLPFLALPAGLMAQSTSAPSNIAVARRMQAHRVETAIHIDGKLDEAGWTSVRAEGDFTTQWPRDRAPASEKTEVRVLYDRDAIYVGVRLFDSRPDSIAAQLARRDVTGIYSDWVHVVIDSYRDRRTGFRFSVNPKGVQKDVRHFDDRMEDVNWDAVWQVETTVDSLGWVAEYRIPLSQLRYGQADANGARMWGIQISRDIARYQERTNWSPIAQTANGYVSRFGDIEGLKDLSAPRRLEAVPYLSGRLTRAPGITENPFYRKNATTPNVGGDVRLGVGSGLTLTATVNPDFGQVELDPAIVNLSAFEQAFPERRPFFVEGADIFNFGRLNANNSYGGLQLLYSRRLGRSPQRGAFSADSFGRRPLFADAPTETSILGAVKLSGKTAGGWSIGILDGVTSREEARLLQNIAPAGSGSPFNIRRSTPVEPLTNYFIGRTRRDFRQGRTVVGAILTHTARDLSERDRPYDVGTSSFVDGPEVFRSMLTANAAVGGLDFEHNWSNRVY
ncbi:MAG: carbohydrate binding family 9 domain-containing protein, partial [Phycisphaerae bacterium]|nr:carbohydrate binding family 9 domain-containing protein [Gemmatimonadaceae bacterium]